LNFYNKNILLILHQGSLGGAERQGLGLGKILSDQYQCKVYILLTFSEETTEEFDNFVKECNVIRIFHFGEPYLVLRNEMSYKNFKRLKWSAEYLFRIRSGLKSYKFHYIFPFLNFPSKIAFYLYKLLPTVKFTFWHQLGLDIFKNDIFENIAARNTPCVISNASNGIELFREFHSLEDERAFILPQYISMDYVTMEKYKLRENYKVPENSIVIGMVAHYRPEKFHELVLNVFEKIILKYPDIHLVFLGNKHNTITTEKKFKKISKDINMKGLSAKVSLLSQVDVKEILNIMDIGILMSRIEGMPIAAFENKNVSILPPFGL